MGSHPVKYVARDSSGNEAVCDITVEVQGEMMNEARLTTDNGSAHLMVEVLFDKTAEP